ncbi:hypothetical protein RRG08_016222 [Elysia crispata]|uniref:Uncharacterized protein n=1 Tax=Elysia crispata TaxID=231223 RepID=A0AAE0ZPH3_9GAST|nr:hypothetical protein RRG08_016222 [Elysia crispata]
MRVIFATSGAPIASVILISPALQVVGMLVLLNDKQKRLTYRFTVVRTCKSEATRLTESEVKGQLAGQKRCRLSRCSGTEAASELNYSRTLSGADTPDSLVQSTSAGPKSGSCHRSTLERSGQESRSKEINGKQD